MKWEDSFSDKEVAFINELRRAEKANGDLAIRVTWDRAKLKEIIDDWCFRTTVRIETACAEAANDNVRIVMKKAA